MAVKMKIGLIGYGYWGPNFARLINDSSQTELTYCADLMQISLDKVKQKYPKTIVTKDYHEIFNDPSVRAVLIVTPVKTHFKIAQEALQANKHVFIEKPITGTIAEADVLIKLAKKKKRTLMVGHTFLYNSAVRYIKNILAKERIGKIRHLHFQRRNLGPIRQDVNVLWDLAEHDISMLLYWVSSRPISVLAIGESYLQKNLFDVVSASIKFSDGILANIILSWLDPIKIREVTIVGSTKMIQFNDLDTSSPVKIYDKNANIIQKTQGVSFQKYKIALHEGKIFTPIIKNKEPLAEEYQHFVKCILKNIIPLTDGNNGRQVVSILTSLQQSLDNNSELIRL
ncbi:hypothetical protein A2313_04505 [Candidatus Roizmanbacteria bacterium RIFOXYB2_FULL_41_10]|uniref:Oxidoreductase n=1 Tax=Candidatus Roizmanbacteria bacterium RIFOXYA1_FULL_41_12 TaxID=1802082 RepID=A0A1F7K2A6_9BACT|nr:MAG: hypothetical protein A2209_05010 [Candidatus Roizmanbacteria bacterium RIFOXYA1_FULL_41_12]OGK66240.1 MAG: hypothetical protein A2262_02330 [Candidatus Roizmanbacteria bacterium RIFOXYA2_FULL_41_8]OGK66915.1 MAG: hypothetical protein A2377_03390 [Candidatus Roizmanbacteria bacterium RIFOXYB1_FULL_41_27]OGK70712.1 MAG: hypothetical protein A2403_01315 [Candidatus Roizmanbacteria bacterium RIFOXYC1_FULL_41_16]OGK71588.1 MAG: hypothetical protein A2313_04505 [Candidatus Roizmanbacteria bac